MFHESIYKLLTSSSSSSGQSVPESSCLATDHCGGSFVILSSQLYRLRFLLLKEAAGSNTESGERQVSVGSLPEATKKKETLMVGTWRARVKADPLKFLCHTIQSTWPRRRGGEQVAGGLLEYPPTAVKKWQHPLAWPGCNTPLDVWGCVCSKGEIVKHSVRSLCKHCLIWPCPSFIPPWSLMVVELHLSVCPSAFHFSSIQND